LDGILLALQLAAVLPGSPSLDQLSQRISTQLVRRKVQVNS
jgi:hypothetical protein